MSVKISELDTGDLVLFDTRFFYSKWIEYFTKSRYSHVGIILRKPTWLDEKLTDDLYLLESGGENFVDAETGKFRFGVQIAPFSKICDKYFNEGYGTIYVRKMLTLDLDRESFYTNIKNAYLNVYDKPYDINPSDWLNAYLDLDKDIESDSSLTDKYQKTCSFWCSALVSFMFVKTGLLDKQIPWTIISPSDFCYKFNRLKFINCVLDIDKILENKL
jgi:hypothetical protein